MCIRKVVCIHLFARRTGINHCIALRNYNLFASVLCGFSPSIQVMHGSLQPAKRLMVPTEPAVCQNFISHVRTREHHLCSPPDTFVSMTRFHDADGSKIVQMSHSLRFFFLRFSLCRTTCSRSRPSLSRKPTTRIKRRCHLRWHRACRSTRTTWALRTRRCPTSIFGRSSTCWILVRRPFWCDNRHT